MSNIVEQAKTLLEHMREDPAYYWEEEVYEAYDEMLDELCSCKECGREGSSLKETDPIAYRCGFSDWLDGEAEAFAERQPRYQEIEDAIEIAEDALKGLEELL